MKRLSLAVCAAALLFASAVQAAPVTWTIPTTAMGGGRTIGGAFVFDTSLPVAQRLVSIDVVETGPTPTNYKFTGRTLGTDIYLGQAVAVSTSADRAIVLQLTAIPATAGGAYTVPNLYTGDCSLVIAGKCGDVENVSSVANVTISSAPVPVPTMTEWALIMFGTALAGGAALYIQRRLLAT